MNQKFDVQSMNEMVSLRVDIEENISFSVSFQDMTIVEQAIVSLKLDDGVVLGEDPTLEDHSEELVHNEILPLYSVKRSHIPDHYKELHLDFADDFALEFRVYDDGLAYRFVTKRRDRMKVFDEQFDLLFADDYSLHRSYPRTENWITSYEDYFEISLVSEMLTGKPCILPVLVDLGDGAKLGITESDVRDYPAMRFVRCEDSERMLNAVYPPYPLETEFGGYDDRLNVPSKRAEYIADINGSRRLPWRVFILAEQDKDLLASDMVYRLARPADPDMDFSWVKPGKVAWDWWSNLNITEVNFKVGINTETYKHYIDFASDFGIEYINLDEGWYQNGDLLDVVPAIDIPEIVEYAEKHNVGVMLWCMSRYLEKQLTEAMDQFEKWGVQGLKIDFFDRDDQPMMNLYETFAREAAKHKLLVNYHGVTKPTGLWRTYPNVINREAMKGLEYNKFSDNYVTPEHAVTIPYTRMLAGPMDFTPGAMTNAPEESFRVIFDLPMSHGTRCQQLAMYVIYDAPLQMLCGSPTAYRKEPSIMDFLSAVPTTWDETVPLAGEVGESVLLARRKGDEWYVGGMTDENERMMTVDFSFLPGGTFDADVYQDGPNAHRNGIDYQRIHQVVTSKSRESYSLSPGGGVAIRLVTRGE